jgi:putative ABC transport system substrate-binding protein
VRRRDFTAALLFAAAGPARAQQPAKQHRIAFVAGVAPVQQIHEEQGVPAFRVFFGELRRLGYVEGRNLIVERYSAEGRRDRYPELARQVVASAPEVIIAPTSPLAQAFAAVTDTIPIVAGLGGDPVAMGLVASLAHPGRNLTGISNETGFEVTGKRMQILKETIPGLRRVGFLGVRIVWESPIGQYLRDVARQLGISLVGLDAQEAMPAEFERVFAEAAGDPPDALQVSGVGDVYAHRELIVRLAEKYRLPALYPYRDYVELGGLMAYADDLADTFRRMANYVHQILNGAKPEDMPIYQATKYEFIVNLKTAKALGLTVPQSILARADEVIE